MLTLKNQKSTTNLKQESSGAVVLMTGATGRIGKHLKSHLLETGAASKVISVSRSSQDRLSVAPCDLVLQIPDLKKITQSNTESVKVDWIVHLATSSVFAQETPAIA